jgi:hypothetical protein
VAKANKAQQELAENLVAGFGPAIHVFAQDRPREDIDARVTCGFSSDGPSLAQLGGEQGG